MFENEFETNFHEIEPYYKGKDFQIAINYLYYSPLFIIINCRRRLCGQAPVDAVAEPHQLRQAGHHDEDDGGGVGPEGRHQGARADRVLGK